MASFKAEGGRGGNPLSAMACCPAQRVAGWEATLLAGGCMCMWPQHRKHRKKKGNIG